MKQQINFRGHDKVACLSWDHEQFLVELREKHLNFMEIILLCCALRDKLEGWN